MGQESRINPSVAVSDINIPIDMKKPEIVNNVIALAEVDGIIKGIINQINPEKMDEKIIHGFLLPNFLKANLSVKIP